MEKSELKNIIKNSIDSQMKSKKINENQKVIFLNQFKTQQTFVTKILSFSALASIVLVLHFSNDKFHSSIHSQNFSRENLEIKTLIQKELEESISDDTSDSLETNDLDDLVI